MPKAVLTISSKNYSSWCLRGWLLCKLAGLEFEEAVVSMADPSARAELLLLSPSFLVPSLTHDGVRVWDTFQSLAGRGEKVFPRHSTAEIEAEVAKRGPGGVDPIPSIPPPPFTVLPWLAIPAAAVLLILAACVGGWLADRAARRGSLGEVMRVAGW